MRAVLAHTLWSRQILDHELDPQWCVRRIKSARGVPMQHPKLWAVLRASSESVAIRRFIGMLGVHENPQHFDAVPHGKRA